MTRDPGDYLAQIDRHFGYPKPDRREDRLALCPFHPDRHVGTFSYGPRGFKCWACDAKGGLRTLAAHLGLDASTPLPVRRRPAPRPEPAPIIREWQRDPDYWRRFLPLPDDARAYYHSRGFTDESIERWRLGYGVLPSSRCVFPRYILPVFEGGRLVMLRGRLDDSHGIPCSACKHYQDEQCDERKGKWLRSAGGPGNVLFAAECLAPGKVVVVTEAPYSAILAMQEAPHVAAVASTAPAHWEDAYTWRIVESEPAWALVWFDHDVGGRKNGQRSYEALKATGINVRLYHWNVQAAEKHDLADVLVETGRVPLAAPRPLFAGCGNAYI